VLKTDVEVKMNKDDVKKIMSKINNWYLGTRKLHALLWGERPSESDG
jgi:hypothetical protein